MNIVYEIISMLLWILFINFLLNIAISIYQNKNNQSRFNPEVIEKIKKLIHIVKIENHNDVYYWFDKETDEFLGQGKTDDELIAHVKSRFPNHMFFFENNKVVDKVIRAPEWKFETYTVE